MKGMRLLLAFALLFLAGVSSRVAEAAWPPSIDGVSEASLPDGQGEILVVLGNSLTRAYSWELQQSNGTPIANMAVLYRSKTRVLLVLPSGISLPGDYRVGYLYPVGNSADFGVHLTGGTVGASALDPVLAADLADAETLTGETAADFHDASQLTGTIDGSMLGGSVSATLLSGTIDNARFSAYSDLGAEARIGTGATQVAAGDHNHNATYLPLSGGTLTGTLTASPTTGQAVVATSDSGSYSVGGIDGTAPDGVGVAGHGNYGVLGDLDSDGSIGVLGRATYNYQTGVYGYSSGQSASAIMAYAAGNYSNGLTANVGGSYSSAIYARNTNYGGNAISAYKYGSGTGLYLRKFGGYYTTGIRVRHGGQGGYGMYVTKTGNYGSGIRANAYGNNSTGGWFRGGYYGTGIRASAYRGVGIYAYASGYAGSPTAARLVANYNKTGLQVSGGFNSTLAVFQYYGSNRARINHQGKGYFNGGTYSAGADFAESVKADEAPSEFEPGDVMVIDVKAPRQIALSREANSPLVAGVISTKPALVGSQHDVAGKGIARLKAEVKLGIVGICPTKVCDENGPIRIGDLLVASSVPGHAMRAPANPAVGTVIGKAFGALESGRGKVEVLLMAR